MIVPSFHLVRNPYKVTGVDLTTLKPVPLCGLRVQSDVSLNLPLSSFGGVNTQQDNLKRQKVFQLLD